jgi:hypothetical protein
MLVFDIESNAIDFNAGNPILGIKVIHCIVIHDTETGLVDIYNDQAGTMTNFVEDGVRRLAKAAVIGGHNITGFDVPAIQHLYPWFKPQGKMVDSLVLSELAWGKTLYWKDKGKGYGKLTGRHSLAAWGLRLHDHKGDFLDDFPGEYADREERARAAFAHWSQPMEDYCEQDVHVNVTLFNSLRKKGILDTEAATTDSQVSYIIGRQTRRGFGFDVTAATSLVGDIAARREELRVRLCEKFPPFYLRNGHDFTPKRDNHKMGYAEGAPLTKVVLTDFNPTSDDHVAIRLQRDYGWKPKEFLDSGHISITEVILKGLSYDVAPLLVEYKMLDKRLSQIAEAKGSWLNLEDGGRVHGKVSVNGTRTGRMSHYDPNQSACPKVGKPLGAECRSLWIPSLGYVLVGADASGIELRTMKEPTSSSCSTATSTVRPWLSSSRAPATVPRPSSTAISTGQAMLNSAAFYSTTWTQLAEQILESSPCVNCRRLVKPHVINSRQGSLVSTYSRPTLRKQLRVDGCWVLTVEGCTGCPTTTPSTPCSNPQVDS